MNRIIKFRGLSVTDNEWVYGDLVSVLDAESGNRHPEIVTSYNNDTFDWIEVKKNSVGQFTGITDANGNDIYEGDIIKFSTRRYHLGREKGLQTITFKSDVMFDDGCYMISETQKYDTYLYSMSSECTITGNIHENN